MSVRWLVDPETNAALWRDLSDMPLRLVSIPGQWVADLGGGNGNFAAPLVTKGARIVTVDVDQSALKGAKPPICAASGSLTSLPIRDGSLDAATARAVLHHVPDTIDHALREARRVVRPGGLVLIQEPTSGNFLANAARRLFPTERHEAHERPLPLDAYVDAVRHEFDVLEVVPCFLLSYLLPHVVGRIPPRRRAVPRAVARILAAWDRRFLAALPRLRHRAAYVSILARRR
ncbi:MAG TPA: class I SAM-dependent methyltransferase [Thermoplasmata archaeon]|nr:class I SAM-dependent methyltransferase [Thermoplasmata archaeon]